MYQRGLRRQPDEPDWHGKILQSLTRLWIHYAGRCGKDVFVHVTSLEKSGLPALDEGAKVTFDTEPDSRGKGPQAVNIQLAE